MLCDDIDDAAHGIGAVERRLRPAQYLDALDVGESERREIELAPGRDRIVDADPVDHHQGVAHVAAADAHGLHVAWAAALRERQAGDAAKKVADIPNARLLNLPGCENRDGAAYRPKRLGCAGRGDDYVGAGPGPVVPPT